MQSRIQETATSIKWMTYKKVTFTKAFLVMLSNKLMWEYKSAGNFFVLWAQKKDTQKKR